MLFTALNLSNLLPQQRYDRLRLPSEPLVAPHRLFNIWTDISSREPRNVITLTISHTYAQLAIRSFSPTVAQSALSNRSLHVDLVVLRVEWNKAVARAQRPELVDQLLEVLFCHEEHKDFKLFFPRTVGNGLLDLASVVQVHCGCVGRQVNDYELERGGEVRHKVQ